MSHCDESYAAERQRAPPQPSGRGCVNEHRWLTANHADGRGKVTAAEKRYEEKGFGFAGKAKRIV